MTVDEMTVDSERSTMRDERARLETFRSIGWPFGKDHERLSASLMAKSGFYRVASDLTDDLVACHRCGIELHQWDANLDNPREEHSKYSPRCGGANDRCGLLPDTTYISELSSR